jgi:hypothetical protein
MAAVRFSLRASYGLPSAARCERVLVRASPDGLHRVRPIRAIPTSYFVRVHFLRECRRVDREATVRVMQPA